jgi:hypothetical protein
MFLSTVACNGAVGVGTGYTHVCPCSGPFFGFLIFLGSRLDFPTGPCLVSPAVIGAARCPAATHVPSYAPYVVSDKFRASKKTVHNFGARRTVSARPSISGKRGI